jgi:energy-coupling factor transport system ATP-binding protein
LIKIRGLDFYYSDSDKPALRNVDLDIGDGEFVLVTGPSGCGKSSLCRCLNGLIPHYYGGRIRGQIEVCGLNVLKHSTREMASRVGMVFQDPENQLVATDVEREVAFGLENLGFPRDVMAKRVEEALDAVGIPGIRLRQTSDLSGGEKQKVAIASVLALHPDVLVLDEPTSELDPKGAEDVLSIIQRLNDELGITVVLIEHRLDRVVHLVDRMIVLRDGGVIADGTPRDVLSRPDLAQWGIGVPPIVRLVQGLNGRGDSEAIMPLTVKEGRSSLRDAFQDIESTPPLIPSKPTGDPAIEVERLWYAYPDGPTALRNVDLTIRRGEMVAVMGRNSSGKTTLVKHFNGLLKPSKGRVKVLGQPTSRHTVAELSRNVGFVFQNPNDHMFCDTVEQEIAFILKNRGWDKAESQAGIDRMLDTFGLAAYRKEYPRDLSGGERQRVAMASVLVAEPEILILDEPTRGMEYRLKSELMSLLDEYRRAGNTVVLVTHDVEMVAEYADRVILLSEGAVVVDGHKKRVLSGALAFSPQINRLMQGIGGKGALGDVLTVDEALGLLK